MTQPALSREPLPCIEFSVRGAPVCQGSKTAFVSGGRAVLVDVADRKTKTMPANRLKNWREKIAGVAMVATCGYELMLGPVELECEFIVPRSPSHYTGTGKLTKSAPSVPTGDIDKFYRAVSDALTGVVYKDDVQIVSMGNSTKRFSETQAGIGGVKIRVRAL